MLATSSSLPRRLQSGKAKEAYESLIERLIRAHVRSGKSPLANGLP